MNPRNTIWRDLPVLNQYIGRCQSILQRGQPNNDVLLYWPIYDLWQVGHDLWWQDYTSYFQRRRYELPDLPLLDANWGTIGYMQLPLHSKHLWFDPKPVGRVADRLWKRGYGFDLVSDRLLNRCDARQGAIQSPGARYQVMIVPAARVMPLETLEKIMCLVRDGATVGFVSHLPEDVPGLKNVEVRQGQLRTLLQDLEWLPADAHQVRAAKVGRGRIMVSSDVEQLLQAADVGREPLVDHGLQFIRRKHRHGHYYFVKNPTEEILDHWIQLAVKFETAALLDPITGEAGLAGTRRVANTTRQIRVQLEPGQSVILRTFQQRKEANLWRYHEPLGSTTEIQGEWTVEFLEGGPELPDSYTTVSLDSWTKLPDVRAERFAGTVRYSLTFDAPKGVGPQLLRLGRLGDSARVFLNHQRLTTLVCRPFQVRVETLRPVGNHLQIDVTNVAANRIRDLDIRKVPWKELHGYGMLNMGAQVNRAGLKSRKLDASLWPVREAGLFGPVTLQPVQ